MVGQGVEFIVAMLFIGLLGEGVVSFVGPALEDVDRVVEEGVDFANLFVLKISELFVVDLRVVVVEWLMRTV